MCGFYREKSKIQVCILTFQLKFKISVFLLPRYYVFMSHFSYAENLWFQMTLM